MRAECKSADCVQNCGLCAKDCLHLRVGCKVAGCVQNYLNLLEDVQLYMSHGSEFIFAIMSEDVVY